MRNYRLYCLDGAGGITLAEWIDAADDAGGIRQAQDLKSNALKCEVWNGTRLVATLDGSALSAR